VRPALAQPRIIHSHIGSSSCYDQCGSHDIALGRRWNSENSLGLTLTRLQGRASAGMTRSTSVPDRFAAAFNARDVDRVLACFTPDATYRDHFYGTFTGHDAIHSLFERMYAEGDRHAWTMTRVLADPDCAIGEWTFTFTVSAAVPPSAGRTLTFTGVSVFETRGGLCHTYREHFDRAAALLALGIRPAGVAAIVARRPTIDVAVPKSGMLQP
jgi:ketosteroid isomerase-like protein